MPLQTKLDESDIDLAAQNFQFKTLRIYSLILLLPALSVCVFAQSKAGIREVDFKNRTFPFTADTFADLPRRIRVRDGLYHSPHQEPGMTYTYFKDRLTVNHFAGGAHCCPPNVFTLQFKLKTGKLAPVNKSLRKKREAEERIPHGAEDR